MENNNSSNPLVSVVVVTYNSSATVIETLDSIKNQSYKNVELIITDDASKDDTVSLCKQWINANSEKFVHAEVVVTEHNTGIAANVNRGCFACHGVWIKNIAGDDKLFPSCVEDYVKFVSDNPTKNVIVSPLQVFGTEDLDKWNGLMRTNFKYAFSLKPRDLKILACKICLFPAPSLFINAEYFRSIGGYDESIRDIEDWPFWIKTAFNGAQFAFLETPEVYYRISSSSLSQSVDGVSPRFKEALRQNAKKTIGYMRRISWLFGLDGFIAYKKKYESNLFWNLMSYLRPLNPYFWKARKLYNEYRGK